MRTPRPRSIILAVAAALALVVAACGDAPEDPLDEPSDQQAEPDDADDASGGDAAGGDAAGGTTMRVLTVPEALQAEGEGSIHVSGLLIDDGSGWRLCEMVLESYPPQCGGESLQVEGVDPAEFPLEESGEVRWQTDATVVGEVDGDTMTVTGSAAAS